MRPVLLPTSRRREPFVRWRDLLWLAHFYPLGWFVRMCPKSLLPLTERAAERAFELARPRKRRLAASRMAAGLDINAAAADALARNFLRYSVQLTHFERRLGRPDAPVDMPFHVIGRDHLDAALARGKGVILNAIHRFASAQVVSGLRAAGYPSLVLISQAQPGSRLGRRWIAAARRRMIDRCFPDRVDLNDPDVALRLVERLRRGGIVVIAADARGSKSAVPVRVLNTETAVSVGILDIARLTGSPVLPCDFLYDAGGLVASFSPALDLEHAPTAEEYRRVNLPKLVAALEQRILRAPDQWTHWLNL